MQKKFNHLLFFVFFIIAVQSCSHVTYNAGFTVPNDKDENVPNVLGSIFFNNPNLSKVRICEYNSKKYLVLIQGKNPQQNGNPVDHPQAKLFDLSQIKNQSLDNKSITYLTDKKTKYAVYTPADLGDELIVFYQLTTLLNGIKRNKDIELYSTIDFNGKTKFIVIYQ